MSEVKACIFCDHKIRSKQTIFETDTELVIYNIRRSNKGRLLIIPKRHVSTIKELTDKEIGNFFKTVKLVARKITNYLKPSGINYGFNEGYSAGQTIKHLHFHLIPRYNGDKLPEFHLFHGDPKIKKNLTDPEYKVLTKEFRDVFSK